VTVDKTKFEGKQPGYCAVKMTAGASRCAMVAPQTILMTKQMGKERVESAVVEEDTMLLMSAQVVTFFTEGDVIYLLSCWYHNVLVMMMGVSQES
jgi:hypothetical protein